MPYIMNGNEVKLRKLAYACNWHTKAKQNDVELIVGEKRKEPKYTSHSLSHAMVENAFIAAQLLLGKSVIEWCVCMCVSENFAQQYVNTYMQANINP